MPRADVLFGGSERNVGKWDLWKKPTGRRSPVRARYAFWVCWMTCPSIRLHSMPKSRLDRSLLIVCPLRRKMR